MANLPTLCVVREPVDWLGSWYRYRARPAKDGAANSTKDMTFDAFVAEYAATDPAPFARVSYPPCFIRDNDGQVMVDHLFQYEQMPRLISVFEDRLDIKINLPQRNVSPRNDMSLSATTRSALEAKFPQMFEDWEAARRT
ncbi:gamma-glutamyl kinase [Octadecabacter sp.]|nr:gamma-glutamyl kinase [Octadecabacter sp.]